MAPYRHCTIEVGDIQTHFLEAGKGPDLVLLHGGEFGASAENSWKYNIEPLSKRFHVIAPDMLGYGLTDKIYSFTNPAAFRIKHLRRFFEQIEVGKAYFVGNSAGAGTILRAAVSEPAAFKIDKMVTICGNASIFKTESQAALEDYTPSMENMAALMKLLFHDPKWLAEETVRERYEASITHGAWEALSAARLRRPGYQSGSNIEEFKRKLARLELPFLIMACEHDRLNPTDWEVKLQEIVKNSRVHRFRHSAHEPQIEEAEEFNRVLTQFLLEEG